MLHFDKGSEWVDGKPHSLDLLIQQIVAANCVVSSRMHVLILAAIHGIPFVALNRAGKMEALLRAIQYPVKLQARLKNVSAAWLLEAILYALSETTLIRQKLLAAAKKQRSEVDNDLNRMSEVLQNRKSD
jgi:polysaccharide pyruvyl transferase WcaK-like protein